LLFSRISRQISTGQAGGYFKISLNIIHQPVHSTFTLNLAFLKTTDNPKEVN